MIIWYYHFIFLCPFHYQALFCVFSYLQAACSHDTKITTIKDRSHRVKHRLRPWSWSLGVHQSIILFRKCWSWWKHWLGKNSDMAVIWREHQRFNNIERIVLPERPTNTKIYKADSTQQFNLNFSDSLFSVSLLVSYNILLKTHVRCGKWQASRYKCIRFLLLMLIRHHTSSFSI